MRWISLKERRLTEPYRPLIKGLTIGDSVIEGKGLFATQSFSPNFVFGITHFIPETHFEVLFHSGVIRTPLGGFINHNDDPNCEVINQNSLRWFVLSSIKEIKVGDELTIDYSRSELGREYLDQIL